MGVQVAAGADDPKTGMTLDELAAFVQQAMRLDVPGDSPVVVNIGFRSQIQKIGTKQKERRPG